MPERVAYTIMDALREGALRHSYARLYPELQWSARSDVGHDEAERAMTADDVFAAARGLFHFGGDAPRDAFGEESQ
jgi:hypothetical protein